jgi:ketosteroid isomerase-like protein
MMKSIYKFISILLFLAACSPKPDQATIESWKAELVEAERQFAQMAADEGISEAFLAFADDNAVLMRGNKVIEGKEAIKARFENSPFDPTAQLSWAPDFIDVAASGDLGYTYGSYSYSVTDSLGNESQSSGIFHTVWKRQEDGKWKFVWD